MSYLVLQVHTITEIFEACKNGNTQEIMNYKGSDWNNGLEGACKGGYADIVELVISRAGPEDLNWTKGFNFACLGGHMDLVQLMLSKGVNNLGWGFYHACTHGHIDVVDYLISKEGHRFDLGLMGACEGGHTDIVRLLISKGVNDWNNGFLGACRGGHIEIVELMILMVESESKDLELDWGFYNACSYGHMALVELMISRAGPEGLDWCNGFENALRGKHFDIAYLMMVHGADEINLRRYYDTREYYCYIKRIKNTVNLVGLDDCTTIVFEFLAL